MNPRDTKGFEILERVIAESLESDEYRERLIDDPRTVLREAGLNISEDTEVVVHENSENTAHLVLPSRPEPDQILDIEEIDVETLARFWPF
jgi:hypothetical protein